MPPLPKTDEYIYKRLIWKAGKHKLPSEFSIYYSTLPPAVQQYLSQQINTLPSEIPTLFFTKPSQEWTLLTTRQLAGCRNGDIYSILLKDIEQIESRKYGSEAARFTTALRKEEWHELLVTGNDGQTLIFPTQKGADLFALWSILLMAVRFY